MSKITITFDSVEDDYDIRLFNRMKEFDVAVEDIRSFVRSKLKHGDISEETVTILEEIREMLPYPVE